MSLGHPSKFLRVSCLGSVTARQSSIGRQPNIAALNGGHHLYLAGRPSRWALAHISSWVWFTVCLVSVSLSLVTRALLDDSSDNVLTASPRPQTFSLGILLLTKFVNNSNVLQSRWLLIYSQCFNLPRVLWHCWLGVRKSVRSVKNCMMKHWHGYLSRARCSWFAYGPADASASLSSLASLKSRMV